MADKPLATNPDIDSEVPADVVDFLQRLSTAIRSKDMPTLTTLYEVELPQLTDRHYSVPSFHHRGPKPPMKHWPLPKYVKQHLGGSAQVELLYQLQQFRSQYTDRNVSAAVRKLAWGSIEKAFDMFGANDSGVDLPNGWVWDMVDEFLYQLQTQRIRRLRPEHATGFPPNVWSVEASVGLLEKLVAASSIGATLDAVAAGTKSGADVTATGEGHLQTTLGYAAMVGLVKLRVLLGDYVGALEIATRLGVRSFGPTMSRAVPPLHVQLCYHVGFAYLMLQRYADAVATLQLTLTVKAGNRKYVEAMQNQASSLLLVAGTLGDLPPQDFAAAQMSDRNRATQDDDSVLLNQGDLERFRDVFLRACPKFITAADITSATATGFSETGQEAKELQLRMFLRAVQQRLDVLKLRGYFGAYSTLTNAKAASLLNSRTPVEAHLVAVKLNARQRVVTSGAGSLLAGDLKRTSVVDFTAEKGSIGVQHHAEQPTVAAAIYDRIVEAGSA